MGHNKILTKKIEDPVSRQQFYSKCKYSIVKKSNELGVLCDTNIALLMFSPTDEVTSDSSDMIFYPSEGGCQETGSMRFGEMIFGVRYIHGYGYKIKSNHNY
uniref:MADS-box domain-containing protein n=1 Tax=Solanum lycopersicum TaxID=4081 RepID=A0A3Q7GS04_SOLLC